MAKKPASNDRRRRIDDIKTQQKKAERRTTYVFVGVAVLLAGALIAGAVLFGGGTDPSELETVGAPKAEAGCGEVKEADKEISARHVGPGVDDPELAKIGAVTYDTIPPTGGDHYTQWAPPNKQFYSRDDAADAIVERFVHNLEHGYVVVWYDAEATDDDIDALEEIARSVEDIKNTRQFGPGPKFIVAPYLRGSFEGENNVGLTAWGASQLCEQASGEVIRDFIKDYRSDGPKSKAPEKNAS